MRSKTIYGFETRFITDEIIRPFVRKYNPPHDSWKTRMWRKPYNPHLHTSPTNRTKWVGFNINQWVEDKVPAVFWGTIRGTQDLIKTARKHGILYFNFDHPYFFRTPHSIHMKLKTRNYRITANAENINFLCNDKFIEEDKEHVKFFRSVDTDDLKISNRLYKNSKRKYILLCPPSNFACDLYDLGTTNDWVIKTKKEIKKYTDREIIIREKKLKFDKPLEEDLKDAYCIVTHQSTAAIKAVMNGVPSICDVSSSAAPVSTTKIEDIENIKRPDNDLINLWIDSLLANQFSMEEIRSGYARHAVWRLQVKDNVKVKYDNNS